MLIPWYFCPKSKRSCTRLTHSSVKFAHILLFGAMLFIVHPCLAGEVELLADNSFKFDGSHFALFGVYIPRAKDKCLSDTKEWPCGATATLRLNSLIQDASLRCAPVIEIDNITLARCMSSSRDIARQLVEQGLAIAVDSNTEYLEAQSKAQKLEYGIWRDGFTPPASWQQYPYSTFNPYEDLLCSICSDRKQ